MWYEGSKCIESSPMSKVLPSSITCQSEIGLVSGSRIVDLLYSIFVNRNMKVGMSSVSSIEMLRLGEKCDYQN